MADVLAGMSVLALGQTILSKGSVVLQLGDRIFSLEQVWVEYRSEVRNLQTALNRWNGIIEEYELDFDQRAASPFETAKKTLDGAQQDFVEMEKWSDRCGFCQNLFLTWAFSRTLEKRKQHIMAATAIIEQAVSDEGKRLKGAQELQGLIGKIEPDVIFSDSRCVAIEDIQAQVVEALSDTSHNGRLVVFLHGEQGIGKSTMARHVASLAVRSIGNQEQVSSLCFNFVITLICGLEMKSEELFKQLKVRLGLKPGASDVELSKRMQKRRLLLILDDVQDPSIPSKVLQLAGDVAKSPLKVFITSNRETVCEHCDCNKIFSILLKDIRQMEARRILAKHTNLCLTQPPFTEELQALVDIIDRVIQETGGNPLALNCFASQIRKDRALDVQEWAGALVHLNQALARESKADLFNQPYPRSCWGMLQLSMEGLRADAKLLLLLLHTLEGETFLEQMVEHLFVYLDFGTRENFRDASICLQERHLITIRMCKTIDRVGRLFVWPDLYDNPGIDEDISKISSGHSRSILQLQKKFIEAKDFPESPPWYSWSIHPLRRRFVEAEGIAITWGDTVCHKELQGRTRHEGGHLEVCDMGEFIQRKRKAVERMTSDLKEEHALFLITYDVCVRREFIDSTGNLFEADCLRQPMSTVSQSSGLEGVEGLALLLARPLTESWTEELRSLTAKTILSLCEEQTIQEEELAPLFKSDAVFSAIMKLLEAVTPVLASKRMRKSFAACLFLELLAEGGIQGRSLYKLKRLLRLVSREVMQLHAPGVHHLHRRIVEQISHLLRRCDDDDVWDGCIQYLQESSKYTVVGKLSIICCPHLVSMMIGLLEKKRLPSCMETVLGILQDVATIKVGAELIIQEDKALANLVYLWLTKHTGALQKAVGRLLIQLAVFEDAAQAIGHSMNLKATISRLADSCDAITRGKPRFAQLDLCLRLLYNLSTVSEKFCESIVKEDDQGTISGTMDVLAIRTFHQMKGSAICWMKLVANLALYGYGAVESQRHTLNDLIASGWNQMHNFVAASVHTSGSKFEDEEGTKLEEGGEEEAHEEDGEMGNQKGWDKAVQEIITKWDGVVFKMPAELIIWDDEDPESKAVENWGKQHLWVLYIAYMTEVLTLLGLNQPTKASPKTLKQNHDVQLLVCLARAKAKLRMGKVLECTGDLEEASNLNRNKQLLTFTWGRALTELRIMREQCFTMIGLETWDRALEKADQMVSFNLKNVALETSEDASAVDVDVEVDEKVMCMQLDGLLQRGMIHAIAKNYGKACADFDTGFKLVSANHPDDYQASKWMILKQRAMVKRLLNDDAGAKDDLLQGAKLLGSAESSLHPKAIFGGFRFRLGLPQQLEKLFRISSKLLGDHGFLSSEELYLAMIESGSKG